MSRRATFSVGATNRTSAPEKLQIPDSPSPAHTRGKKHKTHVLADGENFSNYILRKVQGFYQRHEQGPAKLVDSLIKKYQQFLFQESSYKRMYEEMINQVTLAPNSTCKTLLLLESEKRSRDGCAC